MNAVEINLKNINLMLQEDINQQDSISEIKKRTKKVEKKVSKNVLREIKKYQQKLKNKEKTIILDGDNGRQYLALLNNIKIEGNQQLYNHNRKIQKRCNTNYNVDKKYKRYSIYKKSRNSKSSFKNIKICVTKCRRNSDFVKINHRNSKFLQNKMINIDCGKNHSKYRFSSDFKRNSKIKTCQTDTFNKNMPSEKIINSEKSYEEKINDAFQKSKFKVDKKEKYDSNYSAIKSDRSYSEKKAINNEEKKDLNINKNFDCLTPINKNIPLMRDVKNKFFCKFHKQNNFLSSSDNISNFLFNSSSKISNYSEQFESMCSNEEKHLDSEKNILTKQISDKKLLKKNNILVKSNTLNKNSSLKDVKNKLWDNLMLRPIKAKFSTISPFLLSKNKKDEKEKLEIFFNNNKIIEEKKNIHKKRNSVESIKSKEILSQNSKISFNNSLISQISQKKKRIITKNKFRTLLRVNKVYDSFDDEEIELNEEELSVFIHPDSIKILIFDSILLLFSLHSIIILPLYLAKELSFCRKSFFTFENIINFIIELFNILDIILHFFKAFYNLEEKLITKRSFIIKHYLKGWFIIDFISAIPFYTIFKLFEEKCNSSLHTPSNYNVKVEKMHYLLIDLKAMKIFKILFSNHSYNYIPNFISNSKILIIKTFIILSIFHAAACVFIFLGRNSFPGWITYTHLGSKSFIHIYTCSIYCLITALTSVGYGDITCYSFKERIFQLFLLIIGILAYSLVVSFLSNYIKKLNDINIKFEKRKEILDEINLNCPRMPLKLYEKILRHLKYRTHYEKMDKNIIFDCLPITLKNLLIVEMYKSIINNFIFFKNCKNNEFIVSIISAYKPVFAIKNDVLVKEGDIIEDIIFVQKGKLSLEVPININNMKVNDGKSSLLGKLSSVSYKSKEFLTEVNLSTNFTKYYQEMNEINKQNLEKEIEKNTRYVNVVSIRENEQFGDVLIFLDQRSPIRVKVKSKKALLFYLKKTDAITIYSKYRTIWKKIQKRSIYNFVQIKSIIDKIKKLNSNEKLYQINKEKNLNNLKQSRKIDLGRRKSKSQANLKKYSDNENKNFKTSLNYNQRNLTNPKKNKNKSNKSTKIITSNKEKMHKTLSKIEIESKKSNSYSCNKSSNLLIKKLSSSGVLFASSNDEKKLSISEILIPISEQKVKFSQNKESEINDEIYSNESFNLDKNSESDNLFSRKIQINSNILQNNKKKQSKSNNNFELRNNQLRLLLGDEAFSKMNLKLKRSSLSSNQEFRIIKKETNKESHSWKIESLSTERSELTILSSYENINKLSLNKYINNNEMQIKIKNILVNYDSTIPRKNITQSNENLPKINIIKTSNNYLNTATKINLENEQTISIQNSFKTNIENSSDNNCENKNITDLSAKKINRVNRNDIYNNFFRNKRQSNIDRSSIRKKRSVTNFSFNKNFLQFNDAKKRRESSNVKLVRNQSLKYLNIFRGNDEDTYKNKNINKENANLTPILGNSKQISSKIISKIKKPKNEENKILSLINENMQDHTQNLENPKDFYSSYFQQMLGSPLMKKQKNRFPVMGKTIKIVNKNTNDIISKLC